MSDSFATQTKNKTLHVEVYQGTEIYLSIMNDETDMAEGGIALTRFQAGQLGLFLLEERE